MIRYGIRDGGTPAGVLVVDRDGVRIENWRLQDEEIPEAVQQFDDLTQIEEGQRADNRMGQGITVPEKHVPADQREQVRAAEAYLHQRGFNLVKGDSSAT